MYIVGIAADHYRSGTMSHYTATFMVFLPYMVCMLPVGLALMKQTSFPQKKKRRTKSNADMDHEIAQGEQPQARLGRQLLLVLKNLDTVVFLISVTFSGKYSH